MAKSQCSFLVPTTSLLDGGRGGSFHLIMNVHGSKYVLRGEGSLLAKLT